MLPCQGGPRRAPRRRIPKGSRSAPDSSSRPPAPPVGENVFFSARNEKFKSLDLSWGGGGGKQIYSSQSRKGSKPELKKKKKVAAWQRRARGERGTQGALERGSCLSWNRMRKNRLRPKLADKVGSSSKGEEIQAAQ